MKDEIITIDPSNIKRVTECNMQLHVHKLENLHEVNEFLETNKLKLIQDVEYKSK